MKSLLKLPILLCLLLTVLTGCQSRSTAGNVTGTWDLYRANNVGEQVRIAEMVLRPNGTFHVDLLQKEGIEIEGRYYVQGGNIRFENTHGSDAMGSNPVPGSYYYHLSGDTLEFTRVNDPIDRRDYFLSMTWERANGS